MQEVFERIINKLLGLNRLNNITNKLQPPKNAYDYQTGVIDSIETVKQFAAKYNNGWIPCSERLPTMHECQENDCRFIVTDGNRRYQAWFNIYDGFFEIPRNRDDIMREDKCVIAWQPLPSVWKGENNAEK